MGKEDLEVMEQAKVCSLAFSQHSEMLLDGMDETAAKRLNFF